MVDVSAVSVLTEPCAFDAVEGREEGFVGRKTFMVRPREALFADAAEFASGFESRLQEPQTPAPGVEGWDSTGAGDLTGPCCMLGSVRPGGWDTSKFGFRSSSNSPKETLAEAGAEFDCRRRSFVVG